MKPWKPEYQIKEYYLQACCTELRLRGMHSQAEKLQKTGMVRELNAEARAVVVREMNGRLGEWK